MAQHMLLKERVAVSNMQYKIGIPSSVGRYFMQQLASRCKASLCRQGVEVTTLTCMHAYTVSKAVISMYVAKIISKVSRMMKSHLPTFHQATQ